MYLTLEVISPNGSALGGNRRKVIGTEGALIGRDKANEWALDGKQVSRQHARVRYLNGAFYIEGLGKNTLAINGPKNFVPNHALQLLSAGDTVLVGEFEVRASISNAPPVAAGPGAAAIPYDPFAEEASGRSSPAPTIPQGWDGSTLAGHDLSGIEIGGHELGGPGMPGLGVVDPLALLDGGSRVAPLPPPLPIDLNQGSVLNEQRRLPPVPEPVYSAPEPPSARPQPAPLSSGSVIPDGWEISRIKPIEKAEPPRPAVRPTPPTDNAARPTPPPVEWPASGGAARATPPSVEWPAPVQPAPPPREAPRPGGAQRVAGQPAPGAPTASAAFVASAAPIAPTPPAPPAGPNLDLTELLRAAGVTAANISPEAARDLGQVLRIVIEGVMLVLTARADIKSEFGMPMTRIQAHENNPLKFSPNIEAALHTLLAERNRGYMPAPRAFEDAFADIRNHQLAVLEGIRSAFKSMLARFDPEQLQEEFERQSKRGGGLLNIGGKGRLWEQYSDHFRGLTRDPDECFRRLFGEEFAEAYEKQLERLKTTGRHSRS